MTIDSIRALVSEDFDAVNTLIINNLQSQIGLIDDLSNHIISSGGKRLRPLIVLLSAHACNYKGGYHIPLAAMVEFFHTATLLHDDVVDESTLRRGQETANEIWGSKASILVGDYLFTQSVKLMVDTGVQSVLKLMASSSHEITRGEVKQLVYRNNPNLELDTYFDIIKSKTSVLFAASACIGALISQQPPAIERAMYEYGLHLGNAFQMVDDALDYCADSQQLGKNIGDDLADGKATMPLIHAYRTGTPAHRELIEESLKLGQVENLSAIQEALEATNAIQYTLDYARSEIDTAINTLLVLPDSHHKRALIDLAMFAVNRTH
ncbi:polyprenyl synthetase family protein [Legionella sp. W05-934-2]|jgi:octaprenyl-diphosphate synthase|uniref:polyprenyl synthetase family protein n=1 Tax=Legionella sp. W05-934-2 TaxID=1198649 RepID=UPI0034624DB7